MSSAEIGDFIQCRRRVAVWTARPDGAMRTTSCDFGIHYRELVLAVPTASPVMSDLRRDPAVMLVFSAGPDAGRHGEVWIWARVEFPADPAVDDMLVKAVRERSRELSEPAATTSSDAPQDDPPRSLLVRIRQAVGWKQEQAALPVCAPFSGLLPSPRPTR